MFSLKKNENSGYYNPDRNFYVCSYGGCGSWLLVKYLANFGNAFHVHSRNPPRELTYVGTMNLPESVDENHPKEWFNDVKIPTDEIHKYKVIYLYKDPIKAIYSRFLRDDHLANVGCNTKLTLMDIIEQKKDLYGIEEFFDNYASAAASGGTGKNYDVYCVKYEDFFERIEEFNQTMCIENAPELYPVKKETDRDGILLRVYESLIEKMKSRDFITVVPASTSTST